MIQDSGLASSAQVGAAVEMDSPLVKREPTARPLKLFPAPLEKISACMVTRLELDAQELHRICRALFSMLNVTWTLTNRRRSVSMRSVVISCAVVSALSVIVSTHSLAAGHGGAGGAMPTAAGGAAMHPAPAPTTTTTATTTTTRSPAHTTGQPNQTCGSATAPNTPGNAASAPGSAFNPSGQAGSVYAGGQTQNSGNAASVSQYDVACSHQP